MVHGYQPGRNVAYLEGSPGVSRRVDRLGTSIALLVSLIVFCGCPASPPQPLPAPTDGPPTAVASAGDQDSPNEILQKLLARYREAKSYEDQAVVRLQFKQLGQPASFSWPVSVVYERPNRLALDAYQAQVRVDGKQFKAIIHDPESNNVDGQVVVRTAPETLKLTDLANDPLLYEIVAGRAQRQPIQLELLLESKGIASQFAADVACQLLAEGLTDGKTCQRIAVPSPGGDFIFWVDREEGLLRRLDFPVAALPRDLIQDPNTTDIQFWMEFPGAKLNGPIPPDRFQLAVPDSAKIVKSFIVPPRPLPSQLFGKRPQEFFFTTLDDRRLTQGDLEEKVAILCWYHDNPACEATLQQVALAAKEFRDHPQVVVYGVATDPAPANATTIRQRLAEWQIDMPVVRDLEAFGRKVFGIEYQPVVVVLDKQGRVQIFELGGNPELGRQLAVIVERLLKGDDLAADLLARTAKEQEEYAALVAAGGKEPEPVVELVETAIRRRSDPKVIKLSERWSCKELQAPGNILFLPADRAIPAPRLLVLDGWRNVAELDLTGKVVRRYELELPEQAAVTWLRTTVDKEGKRYFIGGAPLAPQWFLFSDEFKVLSAYPDLSQGALVLTDVQLADLDEDGRDEVLSANVGLIGLHATTLEGEARWRTRVLPNVISIAVTPKNDVGSWQILLTGEAGGVLPVNRFGRDEPEKQVPNWPLARLVVGTFPTPTQAAFVGISNDSQGNLFAIGLTSQLQDCWSYKLPAGAHQRPIEPIASSNLFEGHQGEWWFAAADGSIHMVTEDGKLFDSFACGNVLCGLALGKHGDEGLLFISTPDGVTAHQVRK
jgi:hypothetical protein